MQNTPLPSSGPAAPLPTGVASAAPAPAAPVRIRPTLRLTPSTEPAAASSSATPAAADSTGTPPPAATPATGLPTPVGGAATGGGLKALNLGNVARPGAIPAAKPMGLRLNAEAAATTVAAPAAFAAPTEAATPIYLPVLSGLAAAASLAFAVLLYLKYSA